MVTDTLDQTKKLVWPRIEKSLTEPVYPRQFKTSGKYKKDIELYWKINREYPIRKGKYLRPTLVRLAAEALGAKTNNTVNTAAAMQLSEDWLLIHDDIQDQSLERRGGPALQKIYGDHLAINAGDAIHLIMWKFLSANLKTLGPQKCERIMDEFYVCLSRTALGQGIEMMWTEGNKTDITDEDWFFICDSKAGYYTIALPIRLGAIIAGTTAKQLDKLTDFGHKLGRVFQLVDDILDLTSDFEGLKKQKGNDIFEGKRTLILGHLLRTASKGDKAKVIKILSKTREQKTNKEVDWILTKMNEYGSIDYAKGVATEYKDRAKNIFDRDLGFLSHEPAKTQIAELMQFILERKY